MVTLRRYNWLELTLLAGDEPLSSANRKCRLSLGQSSYGAGVLVDRPQIFTSGKPLLSSALSRALPSELAVFSTNDGYCRRQLSTIVEGRMRSGDSHRGRR